MRITQPYILTTIKIYTIFLLDYREYYHVAEEDSKVNHRLREAVAEWSTYESGRDGVLCSSPGGRADFSAVVEWSNHPYTYVSPFAHINTYRIL